MERQPKSKINVQIYEEACEWFIEFRSGTMDAERCREADRWLRKSPEQLSAYLEIAAIWNDGPSLIGSGQHSVEELIANARLEADNVVAFKESPHRSAAVDGAIVATTLPATGDEGTPAPVATDLGKRDGMEAGIARFPVWRPSRSSFFAQAACAMLAAGAVVAGSLWYVDALRAPTFATQVGEQRSFELADGSTVSLNSRSKVRIRYSDRRRDVELIEGQALFHVAKDGTRPFVVEASGTRVRAVGTEFDVYQKQAGTLVTVVEGRVAVLTDARPDETPRTSSQDSLPGGQMDPKTVPPGLLFPSESRGASGNILLGAGEQLSVTKHRIVKNDHANVANATAWTRRELVFEFATLADAAEEFNRYNVRPLVIAEPALDTFHVTGVFSSTDSASFIRFLSSRPGLRVVETPSAIRIERKSS